MFAKLLKYEWKATAKTLGIFSLAAVGVSVLAAVVLRLLVGSWKNSVTEETMFLLIPVLTMLMGFLILALVAYAVLVTFLLLRRFYKNKFTDEGYLTFTLPVSNHEIFLSSWLNMLIWSAISGAVVLLCVGIIVLFGTAEQGLVSSEFLEEVQQIPFGKIFAEEFGSGYMALALASQIVSFLAGPAILMSCITIGAVAAKKHKILMAAGIYYIYTMAMSMGRSVVEGYSMIEALRSESNTAMYISVAGELVLTLAAAAVGYFLSTHLMKNKLNLP